MSAGGEQRVYQSCPAFGWSLHNRAGGNIVMNYGNGGMGGWAGGGMWIWAVIGVVVVVLLVVVIINQSKK